MAAAVACSPSTARPNDRAIAFTTYCVETLARQDLPTSRHRRAWTARTLLRSPPAVRAHRSEPQTRAVSPDRPAEVPTTTGRHPRDLVDAGFRVIHHDGQVVRGVPSPRRTARNRRPRRCSCRADRPRRGTFRRRRRAIRWPAADRLPASRRAEKATAANTSPDTPSGECGARGASRIGSGVCRSTRTCARRGQESTIASYLSAAMIGRAPGRPNPNRSRPDRRAGEHRRQRRSGRLDPPSA